MLFHVVTIIGPRFEMKKRLGECLLLTSDFINFYIEYESMEEFDATQSK